MRLMLLSIAVAGAVPALTGPAMAAADADPATTARRVGKLESEMRAVQRKVFPGGDPKFFTPDISSAPVAAPAELSGNPASAPINDLTARVDALERQLRTLTGQVEENQNSLKQLDTTVTKLRGDTEFRLTRLEGGTPAAAGVPGSAGTAPAPFGGAAGADNTPATSGAAPIAAAGSVASGSGAGAGRGDSKPSGTATTQSAKPGNKTGIKAAAKPTTAETAEAAWRAADSHYVARDYDAAATGFTDFLAANPKSSHASTAQYRLGRSYAAQSSEAQAAKAYLDGYQKYPKSEQAPDSLIGLGNALTALKKPDQACRALNELKSVYGAKLTAAQKAQAAKARASAKCES